ncbi:TonB-linked SusC/RagA family outer membrane protein [Pedobacter africanus]|uniref:TonB-linked SusC/RagA family outer membrane protein n=1 Tax=Pedobacter africanus TaxID=151894 RepID=A0ACC6KQE1_9SPHI|nr:TonB-dependent receptor [Pedobacter africanus]MDR6781570.1 TonB-linked SusC/RagA family outer membrane protein [Pedobacter africanus]
MNFYTQSVCKPRGFVHKFLLVMKITTILLVTVFLQFAQAGKAQRITLSQKGARLEQLFKEIRKQSGYDFFYDLNALKNAKKIDLSVQNETLEEVLKRCFEDQPFTFVIKDKAVIVKPRERQTALNNTTVVQQKIDIKGKVTDDKGEPLPGVSIKLKGSSTGAMTDSNGNFALTLPDGSGTLVFTFIGFATQEVPVNNRTSINVVMKEEDKALTEVVVVGYGTQKKVNLTGAVASVSGDELTTRQAPNTTSLLQGRMPGVQVTQNSGQPGAEAASIQIRGMGTFSKATNNPLILIDGVEGDLNNVNPNQIENISVLKDAASAAIYGSRAANGVILVTTKAGKAGRLNVDYSYNFGSQRATSMYDRITNSVEFMELLNKAIDHTGTSTNQRYTPAQIEAYRQGAVSNPAQYPSFDWMDAIFRKAPMQQHYLSVNGGKEGTTYNFGAGYLDQDGMLIATGYKRYDVQFNFKTELNKRVTFGTNISFSKGKRNETALNGNFEGNSTEDQILSALAAHPTFTPKLPDGSGRYAAKAYIFEGGNKNPVAMAENGGRYLNNHYALASAYLNVNILPGLKGEIKGAVKYNERETKVHIVGVPGYMFLPEANGSYLYNTQWNGTVGENNLTVRDDKDVQYTIFGTLNYNKKIAENHNLNALLGVSQETFRYDRLQGFKRNAPSGDLLDPSIFEPGGQTVDGLSYEWALQSLFGRLNYDYKEKYLLELNFRNDGSSRFPRGNKWGFFPSASAGWRINQEDFLKDVNWISSLKARVSWGQVGNQNVTRTLLTEDMPYPYQSVLNPYLYFIGGSLQQGVTQTDLINRNVQWETTTVTNAGLDFSLFNSSLSGSVEWYNKRTTDILRELQVPDFIGLTGPTVNSGEMKNTGFEFLLGYQGKINDFRYKVQGNFETYKNKLVKFGAREIDNTNGYIRQEGLPYNSFYMYLFDGIYQNQAEIDNGPTPLVKPKPGDMKYRDVSGPNGVPDGKITTDDRVVVGGAFPKFNYGLTVNADYKNFDLSFFFQGVQGRKIYVREWGIAPFRQAGPPPTFWRNAWDGEGSSNTIPHIFNELYAPNTQVSNWWLQDASYLRLKNLQLGYNLPAKLLNKAKIQALRLYVSGDNLLTFTNFFEGSDPERASANGRAAIYPQAKIYSFGLKVTL